MGVYCNQCGAEVVSNAKYCSYCGNALQVNTEYEQSGNNQNQSGMEKTIKTAATVAGVAVGASLLGNMFRRRRRPPMPPHGMMGRPMGGPGGHGMPPMGGPGRRGPGSMGGFGGRGPMGRR